MHTEQKVTRNLRALLSADVKGYSLLMSQDEITVQILSALQIKLEYGHKSSIWVGATKNLNALQKYLQAHESFFKNADMFSARTLFEKAHNLDSSFLLPYVYLGWIHMFDAWLGLSESPERSIKKALDLGEEAIRLNNALGRYEESIEAYKGAIENTSDNIFALVGLVEAYCLSGNKGEAHKVAKEVNRVYPDFSAAYHVNAMGYRYEDDSKRFLDALGNAGLK